MDLTHRRLKDDRLHHRSLLDDYRMFRRMLIEKNLTVNRLPWQPFVMNQKHWSRTLANLVRQLEQHPELDCNLAIENFDYQQYVNDIRYKKKLFAEIVDLPNKTPLYVFFPRNYNASSLTVELSQLEKVLWRDMSKKKPAILTIFFSLIHWVWNQ